MRILLLLGLVLASVAAAPRQTQRIVGGSTTPISNYPDTVALLFAQVSTFRQACAGVIVSTRSILTVAHCVYLDVPIRWRVRGGSNNGNSGGRVFNAIQIITHNEFNIRSLDNDIAILRTVDMAFVNNMRTANLAPADFTLNDNQPVQAVGWGATQDGGAFSNLLQHAMLITINQEECTTSYATVQMTITANMLCAGLFGAADQCQGDAGGALYANANVVVGLSSFGFGCGQPNFPGVNTRVSQYASWIRTNA